MQNYISLYEQVFEKLDIGIRIINTQAEPIVYNAKMRDIESMTIADFSGRSLMDVFQFKNEQESRLLRALNNGERTKNQKQTYFNSHGNEITTVNHVYPLKDGAITIGAVEIATDITRMEKMLRDQHQKKDSRLYIFDDLIGDSESFVHVIDQARRSARTSSNVLIIGETGTGKELFAQSIHSASDRSDQRFIAQNCAALPDGLIEGILFGTSKGAFTGAIDRPGLFEQANGGTLLLDEINSLPLHLQPKLLRVIQEQKVMRIGESKERKINVRLISTMNEDPIDAIADERLRKDLYYRLSVVSLFIPALHVRANDILTLANFFLARFSKQFNVRTEQLSPAAEQALAAYHWPGNVRELEHVIEGALNVVNGEQELLPSHLPAHFQNQRTNAPTVISELDGDETLQQRLALIEKQFIAKAMDESAHNITKAAAKLGMSRQNLQYKLAKHHAR
ncbi:sigma-54 interaction domain-containing protein [Geomicrobium sp. JSM 1781026]